MQRTQVIAVLLILFQTSICMELTQEGLFIKSTVLICMAPNPTFPTMEQTQATTKKIKNDLKLYSAAEIQAIIARERNLEDDAKRFDDIAKKELLIDKINYSMNIVKQLEKEKKATTAEIKKTEEEIKRTEAKIKKAAENKIKRQNNKKKKRLQTTELPLPVLPTPHTKRPRTELQQTLAIKLALMRTNNCETEVQLRLVYYNYCEKHHCSCIYRQINEKSAWHYSKDDNQIKIIFDTNIFFCDHAHQADDSSSD